MVYRLYSRRFTLLLGGLMVLFLLSALRFTTSAQARASFDVTGIDACVPAQPELVINEIMYKSLPGVSSDSDDWVEIYNPTSSAVDLINWSVSDPSASFVFSKSLSIPANGYLVVVRTSSLFQTIYPTVTNFIGNFSFGLGATGDTVKLISPSGCEVDAVTYGIAAPWPTTPNGGGPSLSLKWHTLDNSQASSWEASKTDLGTPGVFNGGTAPLNKSPIVTFTNPASVVTLTLGSTLPLSVTATDADGTIAQVQFFVDNNVVPFCSDTSAPYACNWPVVLGTHTIKATAFDNGGGTGSNTVVVTGIFAANACSPTPPNLVINEIMYKASGTPNSDDWVEIHNPTTSSVPLGNWSLSDPGDSFFFPVTATLPAGGYLAVVKDSALFQPIYPAVTNFVGNFPFGLGSTGDTVYLANPSGCVVDEVSYGVIPPWPDTPNGGGPSLALKWPTLDNSIPANWMASNNFGGTPGVTNGGAPPTNQSPVITITSPSGGISVTVSSLVAITATAIDGDGTITQVQFFVDNSLTPLCTDTSAPYECGWQATMGLHTLKAVATDNGGASSSASIALTGILATAACTPTPPALVINEIVYRSALSLNSDDWVEIYNPTGNAVTLAGWGLSDSSDSFFLPVTSTLPAGGYLVIVKNSALFQTAYPTVTNIVGDFPFGLNNAGEWVGLIAPGGCAVDELTYGVAAPWPSTPNGNGPSLALNWPTLDNSQAANWSASSNNGGTPGASNGGTPPLNQSPVVTITSPISGTSITVGSIFTVTATAVDSDGTITQVQFFADDILIPFCTDAIDPYECAGPAISGTHTIKVVVTDNSGSTASASITLIGIPAAVNQPPVAALTSPSTGLSVTIGSAITLTANASDADGTVAKVEFLDNGNPIQGCTITVGTLACVFTPTVGSHTLTVRVTDNQNAVSTSQPVQITVNPVVSNKLLFLPIAKR